MFNSTTKWKQETEKKVYQKATGKHLQFWSHIQFGSPFKFVQKQKNIIKYLLSMQNRFISTDDQWHFNEATEIQTLNIQMKCDSYLQICAVNWKQTRKKSIHQQQEEEEEKAAKWLLFIPLNGHEMIECHSRNCAIDFMTDQCYFH